MTPVNASQRPSIWFLSPPLILLIFQLKRPLKSCLSSALTMLISETHQDVETSADGKGSMRIKTPHPQLSFPKYHTPIKQFKAFTSTTLSSLATPKPNSLALSFSARSTKVCSPSRPPPTLQLTDARSHRPRRPLRPPNSWPWLHRRRPLLLPRIHRPRTPRLRRARH